MQSPFLAGNDVCDRANTLRSGMIYFAASIFVTWIVSALAST